MSRILIAEDDGISLILLRSVIRGVNNKIIIDTADDTVKALDLLESNKYDMAFVDIRMPYNGINLIHYIKDVTGIATVAVTAHAMKGDKESFLGEGFDYYISKPIDFGKVYYLINKYIKE